MDTHDEEFGPLIRKQIEADKKAKAMKNAIAQVGEAAKPSSPPSLNFPIEILTRHLIDEEEYSNYGIDLHPNSFDAFIENNRLAKERIPQLRLAIKILLNEKINPRG